MISKRRIIFVILLIVSLVTSTCNFSVVAENANNLTSTPIQIGVDEETSDELIAEFIKASENSRYILYYDKTNAWFALQEKQSGYIWYSVPNDFLSDNITQLKNKMNTRSQLIVDYIYKPDEYSTSTPKFVNSQVGCINNGRIKTELIDDGFKAVYYFDEYGFEIPVEYVIRDSYFEVNLLTSELKETKDYIITAINLLPSFGAGNSDDEGYLFVPDGCGALIDFNNGKNSQNKYDKLLYGQEVTETPETKKVRYESIYMPVFSTVKNEYALTGIITKGDSNASITLINGNSACAYNAVSSKINLRSITEKILFARTDSRRFLYRTVKNYDFKSNYQVRYYTSFGKSASYMGAAEIYRNYLIKEKGLKKIKADAGVHLNVYGTVSINTAFLGIPYTKVIALTTFAQATEIAKEFGDNLSSVRLLGWSGDIMNSNVPKRAKLHSKMGNSKQFENFAEYLDKNGTEFYLDVDFTNFRKWKSIYSIKNIFNEAPKQNEYLRSVYSAKLNCDPYYLLSPSKLASVSNKFLNSCKNKNISGISLSGITDTLYSDYNEDNKIYRNEAKGTITDVIENYYNSDIDLSVESANGYVTPYAKRIYEVPLYSSGYEVFDKEIPFYQIVLHGYVPMTSPEIYQTQDSDMTMLCTVESGIEPLYSTIYADSSILTNTRYDGMYSSTYSLWKPHAEKRIEKYLPILKDVSNSIIVNHFEIAENVMCTVYDNGVKIVVNYTDKDFRYKDFIIGAKDYAVLKGGAAN